MFEPWVGSDWGKSGNVVGGARLLVLGESHYCDTDKPHLIGTCEPATTCDVVNLYALKSPHRFFTGITQVVSGRPKWQLSQGELQATWNSIAFYNYIPVFVATESRVRPDHEMFELGREPFARLVKELAPDAILVCGFELWWWVLKGVPGGFQGDPAKTTFHCIGTALAGRIKHPSAGFWYQQWRPVLLELLDRTGANKEPSAV